MRKSFETMLAGPYKDLAKEQIKGEQGELSEAEEKALESTIEWHVKSEAKKRMLKGRGGEETRQAKGAEKQKEIIDIQKKKQELVEWLKQERARLNDPEYKPKKADNAQEVVFEYDTFFVVGEDGEQEEITLGEIMTDSDWGLHYHLDPETVPKEIRKKFILEDTRRKIEDLLDHQISIDEASNEFVDNYKTQAYESAMESKDSSGEFETHAGLIAEKMVKNFLEKMAYDHEVDFEVVGADIYQDVEQKIDFIIRRKDYHRGVEVEEIDDEKEKVGVQFTINMKEDVLKRKTGQIARAKSKMSKAVVDDLILVSIPMYDASRLYHEWKKDKKAGGPNKLWNDETKEMIFSQVMQGILTQEEIENDLKKII